MGEKVLMKGNEAIGEAAVQAGCMGYFGYPITPQNELTAYMSKRMVEEGRTFIQSESEIAAINMCFGAATVGQRCMTSSSSPGISLKQEGVSYMASAELPVFYVNVNRGGPGLGNISPAQSDYFQATRGGGHGDYRVIAFGPSNLQELYDYTMLGFDLADKYRNPAMILADGILGQMMEPVTLKPYSPIPDLPSKQPWRLGDPSTSEPLLVTSLILQVSGMEERNYRLFEKYEKIAENETRWDEYKTDDAEIVIVSYGTAARISRNVIDRAREEEGIKVGLFRPITIWPYPTQPLRALAERVKSFLVVEMSLGQMWEDVRLAVEGRAPVHLHGRTAGGIPEEDEVIEQLKQALEYKGDAYLRNF
ncbi:MAG: 3-methyl-2-oxobutanoate dehydrogenase subunit VorB [Candidatus Eisenbacteria bacterium]|nr:3-methyl-2-oxobutanoate dehydrogenase subunit VorB [Candidatus Eisenbacteria bacterium]